MSRLSAVAFLASLAMPLAGAEAQTTRPQQRFAVEGRVDAIVASRSAVHAGFGLTTALGTYLRSGLVAAAGVGEDGLSGRVDLVNRFHFDPFRESRWAPYGGGGVSARFDADRRTRFYLLIFAGVDGPVSRGLTTSFEAGFGGGGRIGLIIRRAVPRRR